MIFLKALKQKVELYIAFSFALKDTPLLNIKSQWTTVSPSESL